MPLNPDSELEPTESLELLKRAQQGDAEALSLVLSRYSERLLVRVRLMMGAEARAHAESVDFMQITLAEMVERMEHIEVRDERAFLRWLTTIARNRICDSIRRRREVALSTLSDSYSSHDSDRVRSPASEVAGNEQVFLLVEALEELDPSSREAVELRDLEGLSFREIGERLGMSEHRARDIHRRALLRLGGLLTETPR